MKFRTLVKTVASVLVIGTLAFACLLAWHVAVEPMGGIFEKLIPASAGFGTMEKTPEQARVLEEQVIPEVDPGEPIYDEAMTELAMGHVRQAREKLDLLASRYAQAGSASKARRILSEMNLDEVLSLQSMEGKFLYRVKPGDSYLGIAAREKTTLENLFHLNAMHQIRGLRPGDELTLMPLNGKLVIDSKRRTVSLWDDGFVCEFPVLSLPDRLPDAGAETVVDSKAAYLDGKRFLPDSDSYAAAEKSLLLKQPAIRIEGASSDGVESKDSLLLHRSDMEELNLLVRPGNVVEFR